MISRRWLWILCGVAILAPALTQSVRAYTFTNHTAVYLTFSQSVGLPSVTLRAGTYIFERADRNGPLNVVRVLSRDRRTVYYTGFTNRVPRPPDMRAGTMVSFGEAPAGAPQPIRNWWPAGAAIGHEFVYR
jgi:hypothetical protein